MARESVYQDLIGRLEALLCDMEEGDRLPSEQSLADKYGVSKPTLRRALQELVDSGLVRKVNGVGVIVTKTPRIISRELVFVCKDIAFFAETLKSFSARALKSNYFISIVPIEGDKKDQERIMMSVIERKPAGIAIYADPGMDALDAFESLSDRSITSVFLVRLPRNIDSNLLEFGNADGMSEIVETFYNKGCRKFAFFAGQGMNPAAAREREEGFVAGMSRCRLRVRDEYVIRRDDNEERREAFMATCVDEEKRPDVICAANDHVAGFLVRELERRGVDLGMIRFSGFDHSSLSHFIPRPLLTVEPPMREMGEIAAEMLIRQAENPQFGFQRRKLKARVVKTGDDLA